MARTDATSACARRRLARLERERRRIDAITKPGRRRPVGKDMTQVRVADVADDLGALHSHRGVALLAYVGGIERLEVARPAATRIELGIRREQRRAAANAAIDAGLVMVNVCAAAGRLRSRMTCHLVLQRIELPPPLGVGLGYFGHDRYRFLG